MAKGEDENSRNHDARTKGRPGGVQLPMELSFINVDKPGQRIPYLQLSQITAHAMRRSHERRRGLDSSLTQSQQPQGQSNGSGSYKDHAKVHGAGYFSLPHNQQKNSQKERLSRQQIVSSTAPTSATLVDRTHHPGSQCRDSSLEQVPPEKITAGIIADPCAHPGDCMHCRVQAVIRPMASAEPDMVFGGYRIDPFLRYPIPFQDYFPAVVDHCKEVIAPDPAFLELVMTHDVLFEALTSWVLCTTLSQTPELRKAMLSHYGSTLSKVRKRLLSRGMTRRAVMAAMSNLAGVCAYLGDEKSFVMHRDALQYLAEFNEDETLPMLAITPRRPSKLHDALSSAPPRPKTEGSRLEDGFIHSQEGMTSASEPVYPTLPFPADFSKRLSHLPEGFRELALKRIISIQVIERVAMDRSQIVRLASRSTMDREKSRALRQRFTPLERLIWLGFSVFHLCTATYKPDREELAQTFIECSQKLIRGSETENKCLLWGGCMVATIQAIEQWELPQRHAAMDILLSRFKMSIDEMNSIAQKFLWNEAMSAGLTKIMQGRFVFVPKIEEGAEWPFHL
ncbi:hypothetical protein, variant [Phialophora macrospora]|uniref:Uncharacterized protein n=1 Tax=Phialophora macrospora TaxID=1851006 RepID=A0A0D2FZ74_9EURO|nr:hypothetical protein, variant [Phialophora macrospora]